MFLTVICFDTGVILTGGRESTGDNDVIGINAIGDYSYIIAEKNSLLFRCVSGLVPASNDNIELGELFFGTRYIPDGECNGPHIQARGATISNYVGVINVFMCPGDLTLNFEGVYTCTMRNSSNVKESVRVGVYFPTRSKLGV